MSSNGKFAPKKPISICAYQVKINIVFDPAEFNENEVMECLTKSLPIGFVENSVCETEHSFELCRGYVNGRLIYQLHKDGERVAGSFTKPEIFDCFESRIRLTIAEFAFGKVFLHAGVVGWKGKAIVLPGRSFHGKTTLVSELLKKGADYFSDEYAVLDENGFVYPFPKMLSIRGIIDEIQQLDLPVENFGGKAATEPIAVGMILLTEFNKEAVWNPIRLSSGEALMEIIPHTIPIRYQPEFSLKVLNKLSSRAIITKTPRGEAFLFVDLILDFFEKQAF